MASNSEKENIINSSTEPSVRVGYWQKENKKKGTPEMFVVKEIASADVPGRKGGILGYSLGEGERKIMTYDIEAARKDPDHAHRTLILNRIGWARVDGVFYDFRKPEYKSETSDIINGLNEIDNDPSGQVPIDRSADPDSVYVAKMNYKSLITRWAKVVRAEVSDEAQDFISSKISKLREEGYPQDQAVAIAYSYARKKGYKVPEK